MNTARLQLGFASREWIWSIGLGLAASVAYASPLTIFFHLNIYFGGLFLLLASTRISFKRLVILTLLVQGSLLALGYAQMPILHTIEVLVIAGMGLYWKRSGLFVRGLLYVTFCAAPLLIAGYYLYHGTLELEFWLFLSVVAVNTLFNVMVAELLDYYLPQLYRKRSSWSSIKVEPMRFTRLLYHFTLVIIMGLSMIFLVSNSRSVEADSKKIIQTGIQKGTQVVTVYSNWSEEQIRALSLRSVIQIGRLVQLLQSGEASVTYQAVVVDQRGLVASIGEGELSWWRPDLLPVENGELRFNRTFSTLNPFSGPAWVEDAYIQKVELSPFRLYLRWPLRPYSEKLLELFLSSLSTVALITLAMSAFSLFITKVMLSSLSRLTLATMDIPGKLDQGKSLDWPISRIREVQLLTDNIRYVSDKLSGMLQSSRVLSFYDSLTGLPNRRNVQELLINTKLESLPLKRGNTLGVMYIDLDKFKPINDTYGHEMGDRLLQSVGRTLLKFSGPDGYAARLGGDEFMLIIQREAEEELVHAADRLLRALTSPIQVDGVELVIGGSIGLRNMVIEGPIDLEQLLREADFAMYKAKELGGNRYYIYASQEGADSYDNT